MVRKLLAASAIVVAALAPVSFAEGQTDAGTIAPAATPVLARWKVTMHGSVRHDWSTHIPGACNATGDGHVTGRFASSRPVRIFIVRSAFNGTLLQGGRLLFPTNGTIDLVDARTQNPPDPGDQPCGRVEPDVSGCGHFTTHDSVFVAVSNTPGVRARVQGGADARVGDCETFGYETITHISGTDEHARQDVLIRYPTPRQLLTRHGRFSVEATDTHRYYPGTQTARHVVMTFTRVR